MKRYAVIDSDKVVNVIIANSLEDAQVATNKVCIEYTEENPVGIDWDYIDGNFIAPVVLEIEELPTE